MIQNQEPYKAWKSHKFNACAIRYEVASNIQTGDVVWFNGPFMPGIYNDITIFREGLKQKLEKEGEKAEADLGYRGEPDTIRHPRDYKSWSDRKAKAYVRMRHKTINRQFNQFKILSDKFRHDVRKRESVFRAVLVLTQIGFDIGEKPFDCNY